MGKLKVLTISLALIFLNRPACAQDMEAQELTPEPEEKEHKAVTNDEMMTMGQVSPKSLTFLAENSLRAGNVDKAIHLLKHALSMDNDDADAHALYAEALERKLRKQDEKDPELFNKCVREWLLVMRNEVGEEKGIGFKGLSPPGLAAFYRDEDHNINAKNHLIKLCGSAPKVWETNTKYLKRVLEKPHAEVAGKVVKAKDTNIKKDQYSYEEEPVTKSTIGQKKRDAKVVQQRETDLNMEK
jgi:hypothetical protein